MKQRVVVNPYEYPCVTFGTDPVREVRLIFSPELEDPDQDIRIVHVIVPGGGISEGHSHPDADEYIMFDIGGEAVVDGVVYQVPAGGVVHARVNTVHECRNTDPEKTLTLYCVFHKAFAPYGKYPELIEATKKFIENEEK